MEPWKVTQIYHKNKIKQVEKQFVYVMITIMFEYCIYVHMYKCECIGKELERYI